MVIIRREGHLPRLPKDPPTGTFVAGVTEKGTERAGQVVDGGRGWYFWFRGEPFAVHQLLRAPAYRALEARFPSRKPFFPLMRILHVTHELPPYEAAGTAIYTLNIARAQARDHEVFVFARLQDPEVSSYRTHTENRDGLTIRFMNLADLEWSPFEKTYRDPKAEKIFRALLEEVEPDVIHFQHILGMGLGALHVALDHGVPVVFTLHDFWSMCPMGQRMCYTDEVICDPIDFEKCGPCCFGDGWPTVAEREAAGLQPREQNGSGNGVPTFRKLFQRRVMETPGRFARRPRAAIWALRNLPAARRQAGSEKKPVPFTLNPFEHRFHLMREALSRVDLLITPSAFLRDEFMRHMGIPKDRIIHSANGMDFSYVKTLPKTPSQNIRFGFVGSIIRTKGVHVALHGFLQAAEKHDNIELHIHGAPNRWSKDYLEELEKEARAHPSGDKVHFHGRFDNKRIGETLSNIDALILPSIWFENAPLTLNEAAMTGTPTIVSDRGGMLEFARANSYGCTFELGNPASLAAVLEDIAARPEKLKELAGNRPPIKQVGANAEELIGIYRALRAGTFRAPDITEQTATRGGALRRV